MSRDLIDHNYYITSGGKIPVKWTAPEVCILLLECLIRVILCLLQALHYKKYSVQSDVWGFGCVMYEIWSLGHRPFEELTNTKVIRVTTLKVTDQASELKSYNIVLLLKAIEEVERGYRLPPPPGCSRAIYTVMIRCWYEY